MREMEKKRAEKAQYSVTEMEGMVIKYLSNVSTVAPQGITRNCSLSNDISLDSLDQVELMMWCEKTFNIVINADEESKIKTVGDVLDTVKSKKEWRQED